MNAAIPPRSYRGNKKYPWKEMEVYQADKEGMPYIFTIPTTATAKEKAAILSSAYAYAKRTSRKFTRRDQPDGSCRIYREV